ncbi:hypothetical protein KCU77_g1697, partial [Aureobasidium melanogenum]
MEPDGGPSERALTAHVKGDLENLSSSTSALPMWLRGLRATNSEGEDAEPKDFHAGAPYICKVYEYQAYLKYPSSQRPPSPQTDYDESVTAEWDGGENIHDLVDVKRHA